MKRLVYIANIRLPTEKAHGIQIMKTCEALAKQGVGVELVVPTRHNPLDGNPFSFYNIPQGFKFHRVRCTDFLKASFFKPLGFMFQSLAFYRAVKRYLSFHLADIYYTRDLIIALLLPRAYRPIFYEIHTMPERMTFIHRRAWKRCAGLIVISEGLIKALMKHGVSEEKILLARDAVDVEKFTVKESKAESRRRLGLPVDQKIVVYTGHLYEWKGAGTLAEAASALTGDIHVYLVGGTQEDVEKFKKRYRVPNLHIVGWQSPDMIPYWLNAADILVLPNSAKTSIGAHYTSPLKAFEYIAAGRPIVASDVPALNEILHGAGRVLFVDPDNAEKLAEGIEGLLSSENTMLGEGYISPEERKKGLLEFGWESRARRIKNFIFSYE